MKLPNGDKAVVDQRKVREYLLSPGHPTGRFKLRFLVSLGFRPSEWELLVNALLKLAVRGEASLVRKDRFGRKYVVTGALQGPEGESKEVTSVWIVRYEEDVPRLVTVYPR